MTKRHDRFTWKAGDVVVHDDATKAAKSDWAKHPNHELHDKIVATFAPKLAAALTPSRAQIATAIARAKKKADVEAAKALALNFVKDWAEWDAEHPYVPHPRDAAGGTGHDAQGKPADISGDKGLSPSERRSQAVWGKYADSNGMVDLYHGTASDKVESITSDGLKTPGGAGPGWLMVTTSKEQAAEYGKGQAGGRNSEVVHFRIPATEARQYLGNPTDHSVYGHDATAAGLTHGELPPKYIVSDATKAAGGAANPTPIQQAAQEAMAANTIAPDEAQNILRMIYGNAYLAGSHTAAAQIGGGATLMRGLDEADAAADWSSWTPGWEAAGDAVADGGLADLLGNAGITIQSVEENAIGRLGNVLADGISAGDSVDTISNAIADSVGGNADLIANTETARAMQTATMDTYDANGVDQWDWLAEDSACEICLDAADNGPYDVGDDPDPTIPAHPRCRCAATPVIKIPGLADNEIPGGDEGDDQD